MFGRVGNNSKDQVLGHGARIKLKLSHLVINVREVGFRFWSSVNLRFHIQVIRWQKFGFMVYISKQDEIIFNFKIVLEIVSDHILAGLKPIPQVW